MIPTTDSVETTRLVFFLLFLLWWWWSLLFNVESRSTNNVAFFAVVVDQIGTRAMNEDHLNDNRGYVCIVIKTNRYAFPIHKMASFNDLMIEETLLFRSSSILPINAPRFQKTKNDDNGRQVILFSVNGLHSEMSSTFVILSRVMRRLCPCYVALKSPVTFAGSTRIQSIIIRDLNID